jgi:hypothetical protein
MEPIVNDYFKYKSLEEIEEVERKFEEITEDDDSDGFSDMDADELFD